MTGFRRYGVPLLKMLPWFFGFLLLYGALQTLALLTFDRPSLSWSVAPIAVAGAALFVVAYRFAVRRFARRAPDELAVAPAVRETAFGALIGAVAFTAAVGLLVVAGAYSVGPDSSITVTGTAFGVGVLSGVCEEILFRGILFQRLSDLFGTYGALLGSSIFFGGSHLANPDATLWSAFAIAVEAGVMLGLAFVVTGRLWLPIGIHFAWNYTQGGIFGIAVSGNELGSGLLRSEPEPGRDALTGGAFGVEASPAAVLVCLVVSAALWTVARRRGLVVPPLWRRAPEPQETVSSTLPT